MVVDSSRRHVRLRDEAELAKAIDVMNFSTDIPDGSVMILDARASIMLRCDAQ